MRFHLFFEKDSKLNSYALLYYDAILQNEMDLTQTTMNGINTPAVEKRMAEIDWKIAFELDVKKPWSVEDRSTWENEFKIESIVQDLEALEATDEGKTIAVSLKYKHWNGVPYQELFDIINPLKISLKLVSDFIFLTGRQVSRWMRLIVFYKIGGWKNKYRLKEDKQIIQ